MGLEDSGLRWLTHMDGKSVFAVGLWPHVLSTQARQWSCLTAWWLASTTIRDTRGQVEAALLLCPGFGVPTLSHPPDSVGHTGPALNECGRDLIRA